jgi:predicted SAM-dependent methyltransferase
MISEDLIYPKIEGPSIKHFLMFELRSLIGRTFCKRRGRIKKEFYPLLVDIGAGDSLLDNWIGIDFYDINFKFWSLRKKIKHDNRLEADLRYRLSLSSNSVDGIFSCHVLEHFYPRDAYFLLSEMFRILKPGSYLRIAVPDIKVMVDFYNGVIDIPKYKFRIEGISNCTQNWGHHTAWDEELLSYALSSTGFVNINKVLFGTGGVDTRLIREPESRRYETLVMEAKKP